MPSLAVLEGQKYISEETNVVSISRCPYNKCHQRQSYQTTHIPNEGHNILVPITRNPSPPEHQSLRLTSNNSLRQRRNRRRIHNSTKLDSLKPTTPIPTQPQLDNTKLLNPSFMGHGIPLKHCRASRFIQHSPPPSTATCSVDGAKIPGSMNLTLETRQTLAAPRKEGKDLVDSVGRVRVCREDGVGAEEGA